MVSKPNFSVAANLLSKSSNGVPVRCVVMRGGTSRGIFFHEKDLPRGQKQRDEVIMSAMGAPDPRQVDGLGGGDSLLSKACVVSTSGKTDADVECEFANIAPGKERPTWGTNCGNLIAAVALFAVDERLVFDRSESPTVRIWNRNSDSLIVAQVKEVRSETRDSYSFAGMIDTGSCVHLNFLDPVGAVQDKLLPTGNVRELVHLPSGAKVAISIVDAGAMYVFVNADDVGLTATESAAEMQACPGKMNNLEFIRSTAAKLVGLVDDVADATHVTPDIPKLAFVGPATNYCIDASSDLIDARSVDLVSRIISSQKYHNAYAVTAAIATAAAATVQGSTVQEVTGLDMGSGMQRLRIGHPMGIMDCSVDISGKPGHRQIRRARITRTARRIMEGTVFIPKCRVRQP